MTGQNTQIAISEATCRRFVLLLVGGVTIRAIITQSRPLERVAVYSDGQSTLTKTSLKSGEFYSIVVTGRFNYNASQPES